MEARLERRRGDGEPYEYGGVDWRAVRVAEVASRAMACAEVWLVLEDEGYEQPVDQTNTFIHLNNVAPYMDRILIEDKRDDTYWVWFKDETGDEGFEEMLKQIGWLATRVVTLYPVPDVVDLYEERFKAEMFGEQND